MTVAEMARELGMQPYELLAFADLPFLEDVEELTPMQVQNIREAVHVGTDSEWR